MFDFFDSTYKEAAPATATTTVEPKPTFWDNVNKALPTITQVGTAAGNIYQSFKPAASTPVAAPTFQNIPQQQPAGIMDPTTKNLLIVGAISLAGFLAGMALGKPKSKAKGK